MGAVRRLAASARGRAPVGTLRVVDSNPLNWLYVTYNTVEELVRVTRRGKVRPAAMCRYRWVDERTLDVHLRRDERFADGQPLTAESVQRAFDEQVRWAAPHPPGTHLNLDRGASCEVRGPHRVRFRLSEPDGLTVGKLRATHVMSERFWRDLGFGYARDQSGEGHW